MKESSLVVVRFHPLYSCTCNLIREHEHNHCTQVLEYERLAMEIAKKNTFANYSKEPANAHPCKYRELGKRIRRVEMK